MGYGQPPPGRSCTASLLQAKKVDYMELPQPVRYEELQREVMSEWASAPPGGGSGGSRASLPAKFQLLLLRLTPRQAHKWLPCTAVCCGTPLPDAPAAAPPPPPPPQCRSSPTCLRACAST